MPQDRLRELLDLSAVHFFYISMLQERLGHPVPPHEIRTQDSSTLAAAFYQWLDLLDLAVSPTMVRDALRRKPAREALEALLRIYILKASLDEGDRDKADFLATYLYRNPPSWLAPKQAANGDCAQGDCAQDFERELRIILGGAAVPEPPPEHFRLAEELDNIRAEVEGLRTFNQLTDSAVVLRVRGLKQELGGSFYHPAILARMASYNAFFGRRFDELSRAAAPAAK